MRALGCQCVCICVWVCMNQRKKERKKEGKKEGKKERRKERRHGVKKLKQTMQRFWPTPTLTTLTQKGEKKDQESDRPQSIYKVKISFKCECKLTLCHLL